MDATHLDSMEKLKLLAPGGSILPRFYVCEITMMKHKHGVVKAESDWDYAL